MEKLCVRCKTLKLIEDFTKKKNGKLSSWCKKCYNLYYKEKGYGEIYRKKPEYKSKSAIRMREYRKTRCNQEYEKNYRQIYHGSFNGTVTKLLCSARDRAKKDKLPIDIDREWIKMHLTPMKCEATGVDLTLEIRDDVMHSPFRPSIDRKDNSKGYTKTNCQIVCVIYNKAKSDYESSDVIRMAKGLLQRCQIKFICSSMEH